MLDENTVFAGERAIERRHDTGWQRPIEAERIAVGVILLANLQVVTGADRNRYRGFGGNPNLQDGNVVSATDADQRGCIVFSVGKPNSRLRRVRKDVPIDNDKTRTVPDEARARPPWDRLDLQSPVVEDLLAGGDVYV